MPGAQGTIWSKSRRNFPSIKLSRTAILPVGIETVEAILSTEGSGRRSIGGKFPVIKHGPWVVAHLRLVTPFGDPV
jgi:hypothetical protein